MIQKKICLLGGYAVGKTSLVKRFVESKFSEKYKTSIGVKIDKKSLKVGPTDVSLMIWDMAGEDEFGPSDVNYLRGTSGYMLVLDGTRRSSLDRAFAIQQRAEENLGRVPFVTLINKTDLADDWELRDADFKDLEDREWTVFKTSAKTGESVEAAFVALARAMLGR